MNKNRVKLTAKKITLIFALAMSVVSCKEEAKTAAPATTKEEKTAYIDTAVLMKEYTEAKDLQEKFKAKSEEKGRQLQAEINRFKNEAANFQSQAQANGQEWAQKRGAELQRKEQQLAQAEQLLSQQLQQEAGTEMDSLVISVKKFIKDYGKSKGYKYIFGTGEPATILYAEDKLDITKEIVKLLNERYKSEKSKK